MKQFGTLFCALAFAGALILSVYHNPDHSCRVQVAILDTCGEQIWPPETLPNSTVSTIEAEVINGELSFMMDDDQSPFLEYLQYSGASTIRVWKEVDGQFSFENDYPIQTYVRINKTIDEVPTTRNAAEELAYHRSLADLGLREKPENPAERDAWRLAQKGGEYDPQKVLAAQKTVQRLVQTHVDKPANRDAGINTWSSLGPGNTGGRIRAIAIDPNDPDEIFIGSVAGGMWKTTNGGTSWSNVSDFLPNMSISQILYDPTNSNIMYASTGEGFNGAGMAVSANSPGVMNIGIGVLRSTNGGFTWEALPQPNNMFHWVNDIAIDPNNPTHLYAVTAHTANQNTVNGVSGAIYKTTDSGENWELVTTTASRALDVKIDPFDSDNVLVGCSSHLYRSTDATDPIANISFTEITGGTNEIPNSAGRIEIAWARSNSDRVYASVDRNGGEIWRSENAGATWVERTSGNFNFLGGQGWYDNVIWVDPTNSSRVVVGGIDAWYSSDGGANLTKISDWNDDIHINDNDGDGNQGTSIHADQHVIVEAPDYSSTNRRVYFGNDGGIYSTANIITVSQNSGWNDLNNNIRITQFYGGAASRDRSLVIGGAQDNAFNVDRSFGGTSWFLPRSGDGAFAAVNYNNENIAYANTNNNQIFQTTDNGQTWNWIAGFNHNGGCASSATTGCTNGGVFRVQDNSSLISKFTMDPNNPNIIYACAQRLWRNNAAGNINNWTNIRNASGGQVTAMDVGSSSNTIWVGTANGNVDMTATGGAPWTRVDNDASTPIPGRFVTDIAIDPNNSNRVMVTLGGYGQDNIWYTNNAGDSWFNRSLNFDMQINTVVWHPTKTGWVYVGTDFGIFASENYGVSWSITPVYADNEGPFNGEISELFFVGDGSNATPYYLYAATFARGMWRTGYPIRDKIYVDKDYVGVSTGSFSQPYSTVTSAVAAAGSGSEIIFLSSGTHSDANNLVFRDRVTITLQNGGGSVLIN